MNRLALAFGVTSVIFAGTTAYFARELHRERASHAAEAREPVPAAVPTATATVNANSVGISAETSVAPVKAVAGAVQAARSGNPTDEEMEAESRKRMLEHYARLRTMLADPQERIKMLLSLRKNHERELSRLVEYLDLSQDEYNRLLDMLGEHQMRISEAQSQCTQVDCDMRSLVAPQSQINRRELVEFLGAERAQQFHDFRDNTHERSLVAGLRGDLPDAIRLTDAQARKLAEVLGEERRRVEKEWEQRGAGISAMRDGYGTVMVSGTAQGVEQKVAEASEFQRKQRERAAEVLTPPQLEIYTRSQQQALEMARLGWEHEEGETEAARTSGQR